MANQLRKDPTRTTLIRRSFEAQIKRRFARIKKLVRDLIVVDDVFGMEESTRLELNQNAQKGEWRFLTDAAKVKQFRRWLQTQVDSEILSVDGTGKPWTNTYIHSSYKKAMVRAYGDVNPDLLADKMEYYAGGKDQFINSAFNAPETVSKLELLYTRAYDQLKDITTQMGQQMSRILTDGIAHGKGIAEIARNLRDNIDKITDKRARVLARTEVINAHAEGALDGLERLGVKEVEALVEFSTAGDDLVCPQCMDLEGTVYTIEEARGLIPVHPNCRCAWIPAGKIKKAA